MLWSLSLIIIGYESMKNKKLEWICALQNRYLFRDRSQGTRIILIPEGDVIIGTSKARCAELLRIESGRRNGTAKIFSRPNNRSIGLHLPAFEIAKYPVTNFEYHEFGGVSNYRVPRSWIGFSYPEVWEPIPLLTSQSMMQKLYKMVERHIEKSISSSDRSRMWTCCTVRR
jgi:formylglycine-generating enzyme required for sulfatase activity